MDEHARIRALQNRLERTRADIQLGIGDDAAVLAPSAASLVCTVDASVEGVHFERTWASWRDIGRRAYLAAMSDVAAMGAKPRATLLALALPASFDDESLFALVDGVAEGADESRAPVIGGNLARASEVSITTTVLGELTGRGLLRSGARPGDGIYLTGTVGGAALGLRALQRGLQNDARFAEVIERWRRPVPKLVEGQRLTELATAAIDVSDGVLQDLRHVCDACGLGAHVRLVDLPLPRKFAELAAELGEDPWRLALAGGEDYELLFAAPAGDSVARIGTRIGTFTPRAGEIQVIDANNQQVAVEGWEGFDHFRG